MSTELPMFCPRCGALLDDNEICPQCGLNVPEYLESDDENYEVETISEIPRVEEEPEDLYESNTILPQIETVERPRKKEKDRAKRKKKVRKEHTEGNPLGNFIKKMAPHLWIINIVWAFIPFLTELIIVLTAYKALLPDRIALDWLYWTIIGFVFSVLVSFYVIKPAANLIMADKWETIVTDYSKFGKYRIPQILFWGIMETIIVSYWGGIPLLLLGIYICFFTKYKELIEWKEPSEIEEEEF